MINIANPTRIALKKYLFFSKKKEREKMSSKNVNNLVQMHQTELSLKL